MNNPITTFLFTTTGAFVIWITKGFKGPLNDEMVSIDKRNSAKGTARFYLGFGVWLLIIIIAGLILTRPAGRRSIDSLRLTKREKLLSWKKSSNDLNAKMPTAFKESYQNLHLRKMITLFK